MPVQLNSIDGLVTFEKREMGRMKALGKMAKYGLLAHDIFHLKGPCLCGVTSDTCTGSRERLDHGKVSGCVYVHGERVLYRRSSCSKRWKKVVILV